MFSHLHWHSHYSLLEAIGKPKDIVAKAEELGMSSIALTDYNGLYGAIEFYQACKDVDIKPIIWVELGYVPDHTEQPKQEDIGTVVLVAKNYDWYQALLKLVSEANLNGRNNGKARIDFWLLQQYSANLIVLLWGKQNFVSKLILKNESESKITEEIERITKLVWPKRCIIELLVQDHEQFPEIKKINTQLESLASKLKLPLVCTNNYHYVNPEDQKVSEVALAIKDSKRMFDDDRRKKTTAEHIMSEQEISDMMEKNWYEKPVITQMIQTSKNIAESIDLEIPLGQILFPKYESPDDIKKLYEQHKDKLVVD